MTSSQLALSVIIMLGYIQGNEFSIPRMAFALDRGRKVVPTRD